MGKRRVGFKHTKKGVDALKNVASSDDEAELENNLENLLDDEIESYNKYKQESLKSKGLKKKKHSKYSDDEEEKEVFPLELSDDDVEEPDIQLGTDEEEEAAGSGEAEEISSSSEDEDDLEEDDEILGRDAGGGVIPDTHAWGRKSRAYHNTDYVDQDFGGFEGSDAELAEQEEVEAQEIQKRLTAELDEDAFADFIPPKDALRSTKLSNRSDIREVLKLDFDNMTLAEKRKLVQRECPELIHMLEDYKEKLVAASKLKNLISVEEGNGIIKEFYTTKYHTILNYCINISFYLYLRSTTPTKCRGHPVVRRILQFRRLLEELETFNPAKVRTSLSILQESKKEVDYTILTPKESKVKKDKKTRSKVKEPKIEAKSIEEASSMNDDDAQPGEKRGITYEMVKNKGLTPVRQKVQRNPRVKHRLKYRKATVRRKGQVRAPRTEVRKYEGELSGIKSHVTKSIKIK